MSKNYYSEINLHLVWRTKHNGKIILPAIEGDTYRIIRARMNNQSDVLVHEIGGIEDHVHVAVSIPPTLTISEWIGEVKGGTSYDINRRHGRKTLRWQRGYGVVSFGSNDLPWVRRYIRNQRSHHLSGTTRTRLERISEIERIPLEFSDD